MPVLFFGFSAFAIANDQWIVAGVTLVSGLIFTGNLLLSSARAMNNIYVAVKYLSVKDDSEKIIEMVEAENEKAEITEMQFIPLADAVIAEIKS